MNEKEMLRYKVNLYAEKLKELLTENEYNEFVVNVAKETIKHELEETADSDF